MNFFKKLLTTFLIVTLLSPHVGMSNTQEHLRQNKPQHKSTFLKKANNKNASIRYKVSGTSLLHDESLKQFIHAIQEAVKHDDKKAFSKLIHYPMRWNIREGHYIDIKTPVEFMRHYNQILTPDAKEALSQITLNQLWLHATDGFTVNHSRIWFFPDGEHKGIYLFNDIRFVMHGMELNYHRQLKHFKKIKEKQRV